jgi:pimeloyl-ACP methyl ester carboxylesterase
VTLFSAAALLIPAPGPMQAEGLPVTVSARNAIVVCRVDRILPDPSSRRVVLWNSPRDFRGPIRLTFPEDFFVAEIPGVGSDATALTDLLHVGATARVVPLRWSESGDRLLIRVRHQAALLYDPVSRALTAAPEMDPLWTMVRIEAMSHGDLSFYRRPQILDQLRRIEAEGRSTRTIATLGRESAATFLVFRMGNRFRLTAYEGARRWETGVPIAFASSPMLPPGARKPLFLGSEAAQGAFLPYALPLIDRRSGQVVGRYGWEQIHLRGGRVIDLQPHFNQLMTIRDASANGDTVFALADLEREVRLVRIEGEEVRSWRVCEKNGRSGGTLQMLARDWLDEGTDVTRTRVDFGPAGRAPFGFLYRPAHSDGRLLVYFHGGPTSTLAGETVPQYVREFARHGISVLMVEQSGMLGGGLALSQRLPRLGFQALRQDVGAVTLWVRRSGFPEAYLMGTSFGGASAVIAAVDHPDDYRHIFLHIPFLALRTPERTVDRENFASGQVAARSQLEFEEAVYGGAQGRRRFAADLQAHVRRLRPSPRLSFYFGSRDPVSAVTDLPPAFAGHPSVIVTRTAHGDMSRDRAVRRDMLTALGIDPAPADPPLQPPRAQRRR